MKKTNWDPYSGAPPPPPPPPRSLVNQRTKPELPSFGPPPSRTGSAASSSVATNRAASSSPSPGPAPPLPTRKPSSIPPALPSRSNSGEAPPAPPPRSVAPVARTDLPAGPPPPVVRSTRPDFATPVSEASSKLPLVHTKALDWSNLSQEDKEAFFDWLDEFFSKHLNITFGPRTTTLGTQHASLGARSPPPTKASVRPHSFHLHAISVPSPHSLFIVLTLSVFHLENSLLINMNPFLRPSLPRGRLRIATLVRETSPSPVSFHMQLYHPLRF